MKHRTRISICAATDETYVTAFCRMHSLETRAAGWFVQGYPVFDMSWSARESQCGPNGMRVVNVRFDMGRKEL